MILRMKYKMKFKKCIKKRKANKSNYNKLILKILNSMSWKINKIRKTK